MSTVTIPNLPAAGALTGTELLPILQNKSTSKTTIQSERERLMDIINGTNAGTWEWNIQTGETVFNENQRHATIWHAAQILH
jgi:succinate dehydrogenase/fumarate reductase flavoprotein subunit